MTNVALFSEIMRGASSHRRRQQSFLSIGVLQKVQLPGGEKSSGFREADVDLLISAGVVEKSAANQTGKRGRAEATI